MLFNQHLDMQHLSGGWIILAKEKRSHKDVDKKNEKKKKTVWEPA